MRVIYRVLRIYFSKKSQQLSRERKIQEFVSLLRFFLYMDVYVT